MLLEEVIPTGESSKFIESYWTSHGDGRIELIPQGTFHIIFSLEPFIIKSDRCIQLKSGLYLLPISTIPVQIIHDNSITAIRCKAFTMASLKCSYFDKKQKSYWRFDLKNQALAHFHGPFSKSKIDIQNTFLVERFIFEVLTNQFELNHLLRDLVNYILMRHGKIKVSQMSQDFNINRQSLHWYFKKHLHISPKQLGKIWKINYFLHLANSGSSLTTSAIDSGYFDQAHCNNEFKNSLGQSPKSFLGNDFDFTLSCIKNRFNNAYDPTMG